MRHQHALIAQAKFAAESSGQFDQDLVPRLCGYLHSLPKYQFSDGFGLKGMFLPFVQAEHQNNRKSIYRQTQRAKCTDLWIFVHN